MKIFWRPNYELKGNGYGYTMHQKNLRAALEKREDVSFTSDVASADVAVSITMPTNFAPLPGVFNVLYTMYETATLPADWVAPLRTPDLLVVPNMHNFRLFTSYVDTPTVVVWEGIDPDVWRFHRRARPHGRRFVFLWIGASNPRKGYQHVATAWGLFCQRFPEFAQHCALIMKTTQDTKPPRLEKYPVKLSNGGVGMSFVDTRDYSLEGLVGLYQHAHAFLFPSMGEGWGLTLHEAMATGLPSIYTNYSAMKDWVPKKYAWPLRFRMTPIQTLRPSGNGHREVHHRTAAASADVDQLVRYMARLYEHYEEALKLGEQGATVVRKITWASSAEAFVNKINNAMKQEQVA